MESSTLAPTRIRRQQQTKSLANWTAEEDALLHKLVTESASFVSWSMLASFFPNKTAAQLSGRWDKVINPALVKGSWTTEEDETIITFVRENGDKDWAKLALLLKGRTGKQCRERYRNHLDTSVKRTPWTKEEDERILQWVKENGTGKWKELSLSIPGRIGKQLRERWYNHLDPTLKKGGFTEAEDEMIIDMHQRVGSAWQRISEVLPGRSANSVKNRYHWIIRNSTNQPQKMHIRKRGLVNIHVENTAAPANACIHEVSP